jgi:HEAT repeat protein
VTVHLLKILSLPLLVCYLLAPVSAQTSAADPTGVLTQLLSMPAPTPRTSATPEEDQKKQQRPEKFFEKDNAPPDDAPMEDILEYWNRWAGTSGAPVPSDAVRQRLLDACVEDLETLPQFLSLLSSSEATAAKVKELYDKGQSDQQLDDDWREKVRKWLLFNSKYFATDLLALANKARDDEKGGYVDKEDALVALAKVDWLKAEPLVRSLATSSQRRTATLAFILLYKHAIKEKDSDAEEKYRNLLKSIAGDRNAPAQARDAAIEALSLTDWSGRDDWYLSLFQDETLIGPSDGIYAFSPLTTLFAHDPEKWIPIMAQMVESKDFVVRSAAASCLITFQNHRARKDALKPLLPWLSNPGWAKDRFGNRLRLIQSMDFIDLPESVPGLIWTVEHDESAFERSYAAESLAKYKDPRAAPVLRKALRDEKGEDHRRRIILGLIACGGLTEEEQVNALEAYATKMITPEGREEVSRYRSNGDDPLPIAESIGKYLAWQKDASESFVKAVLARATILKKTNQPLAQSLLEIAQQWQSRQVDLDMIRRIAAGTADAKTIANALTRREKLRETLGTELQSLMATNRSAQGIAAVLLDDSALIQSLLSSGNELTQIAVLAAARLTQTPLPVDVVGGLLRSKNSLLALSAERYLLVEDSKEARELLWRRHPNEAFVTGWRENIGLIGGNNFELMAKMEERLRGELFKDNSPLEIFALISNAEQYGRVLRVYADRAVYTYYENAGRYRERVVPSAELAVFKEFVTANNIPDLGPQITYCHHDCWPAEFLSLTKAQGRRVFSHQGIGGWITVIANFDLLGRGEGAKIHYNLEKEIKGLEVLYADEHLVVKDVWQGGNEIRIFVERDETEDEIKARNEADDEDSDLSRAERRRREVAQLKARFSWRKLLNEKAGDRAEEPSGYSAIDETRFPSDDEDEPSQRFDDRQAQMLTPDSIIFAKNFGGLWRQTAGQKPVRISGEGGAYANPIITPDGKWVVVAKTDSHWGDPNYVARFNLRTRREFRVNLEPADQFDPIAFMVIHDKVLLRRARDDDGVMTKKAAGPQRPEYYLLDPATGETRLVSGEFAPLRQEGKRFLQPTGKANEFWAAIPDYEKNQTQVGRYNLKDFSFQTVLDLPHLSFNSMSMWVDEAGSKLYVVYESQLLRMPLSR